MKTRKTRIWMAAVLAAVVLFFWLEDSLLRGVSQKFPPHESFKLLARVISLVRSEYIEEPEPRGTMEGAFQGLVGSLDILSSYLDKPTTAKYLQPQKPAFKDIGLVLLKHYGIFPVVVGLIKNSPAEKAGIRAGDTITGLDDKSTLVWSLSEINIYLKDKEKKAVKLRVVRDTTTKEIPIERADIYPQSVSFAPLKDTAGMVKIHHFFPPLLKEFKANVLPGLKSQKGSLVLDLRNCCEGDLEEARKFLNVFLKSGKIGYLEKRAGSKDVLACPEEAALENLSLVVWVNPATMGPSEMVAAVLKDFKRAKIIGSPTSGLAARQDLFSLEGGDALLLTTGVFCLNSGEKIWGKGVQADIKLGADDQEEKNYIAKTIGLISGS
jgi:carboxyl-terminal processing protease